MKKYPLTVHNVETSITNLNYRRKFGMLKFFDSNNSKKKIIVHNLYGYDLKKEKKDQFEKYLIDEKFDITEKKWIGNTLILFDRLKNKVEIVFQIPTESKLNWGNTVESILTVAIGCRFKYKDKKITTDQYYNFLNEFNGKSVLKTTSDNKDIPDKDNLTVTLSLTKSDSVFTRTDETKYQTHVKSALQYVNDSKVRAWSTLIYENNRIDSITVTGKGKQGGKVDTEVRCTGQDPKANMEIKLDLSVKANSIEQFGQAVGSDFNTTNTFLRNIFGYGLSASDQNNYNNLIINHKVVEAFQLAYKSVQKQIETNGVDPNILINGIKQYATGGNPEIRMLVLGRETKLLDFEKLQEWADKHKQTWDIINSDLYAEYNLTDSDFPKISIKLKGYDDKALFQVRSRQDRSTSKGNITYRHYIEKKELLTELTSISLEEG